MRTADAAELLAALRANGVTFHLHGAAFTIAAPPGVVSRAAHSRLLGYRTEIWRLLHTEARLEGRLFCGECLREVHPRIGRPFSLDDIRCTECGSGRASFARLQIEQQRSFGPDGGLACGGN